MHEKDLWKVIKNLERKYTPKYMQMRNKGGTLVPLKKRAEASADSLEKCQWTNDAEGGRARQINQSSLRDLTAEQKETADNRQRTPF